MIYEKKEILEILKEVRKAIHEPVDTENDLRAIIKQRVKILELLDNVEDYILFGCRMP